MILIQWKLLIIIISACPQIHTKLLMQFFLASAATSLFAVSLKIKFMILRKCSLYTCPLFYAIICAVLTSQSLLSRQHFCQNNSVLNFLSHIRACEWFILYIHWMFIVAGENVMEHWNSRDFKMNATVWTCNINMTG